MNLPAPTPQYDPRNEAAFRAAVAAELAQMVRKNTDIEIAGGTRLIFTAPNATRYSVTVSNTPGWTFTTAP